MNLYTPQVIQDLDGDGVLDVLAVHGGDPLQEPGSAFRLSGRIILFSGKTGKVLQWVGVPDQREAYFSPVVYTRYDGTQMVLFGTGGETHPGALWAITLDYLHKGKIDQAVKIYSDDYKGVMTPPVLADINRDGVEDIIIAIFNSTVLAIDGSNFDRIMWNYSFPMSETYNTPAVGYYNDDDTPDFMVKYDYGPGFPIYYHSKATVLDGKTGQPLINPPVRDTIGSQASPLTVSFEGLGNDLFLYWVADCEDHVGEGGKFSFVKGTNVHEQSRSDFCRLRFKTKGFSKLYAINSHIPAPGATVYYSGEREKVEHASWINTTQEAIDFVRMHPEHLDEYQYFKQLSDKAEKKMSHKAHKKKPTAKDPYQSKEYISKTAHYGNERTSSSKKGPPMGQINNRHGNSRIPQREPDLYSRYPDDRYGTESRGRYQGGLDDYTLSRKRPAESQYGSSDRYELPFDLKEKYPFYYQNRDEDYDEDNTYENRYPQYRTTKKRSSTPRTPYFHMKNKRRLKRDLGNEESDDFWNLKSLRNLQIKLAKEAAKRQNQPYIGHPYFFMKRKRKRRSAKLSESESRRHSREQNRNRRSHQRTMMKEYAAFKNAGPSLNKKRKKRHVGPHDNEGLQRLLSTGTVAPSTLPEDHADYNQTIDVVFATYWFFPAKTQAILPQDQKCISEKLSQEKIRFDPKSKYYGLDHDGYEHAITQECLGKSGHQLSDDGTYESQMKYNPYNVHMGQMTLYRIRIKCSCSSSTLTDPKNENKRCARTLPFDKQQWPSYMGRNADSHWLPRD